MGLYIVVKVSASPVGLYIVVKVPCSPGGLYIVVKVPGSPVGLNIIIKVSAVFQGMTEEEESSETSQHKYLFTYMDESVSRVRLNHFIEALKDSANESFNPLDTLQSAASKFKLQRLDQIIHSVMEGRYVSRENSGGDGT
jgi:hypothetical protein